MTVVDAMTKAATMNLESKAVTRALGTPSERSLRAFFIDILVPYARQSLQYPYCSCAPNP